MQSDPAKLLKNHAQLVHTEMVKVTSHVQRPLGDWVLNTVMIEGYDVPFRYRRKRTYKQFSGQRVNLTYYPDTEQVAGIDIEIMKVVRITIS